MLGIHLFQVHPHSHVSTTAPGNNQTQEFQARYMPKIEMRDYFYSQPFQWHRMSFIPCDMLPSSIFIYIFFR